VMRAYAGMSYFKMAEAMNHFYPGDDDMKLWTTNLISKRLDTVKGMPEFGLYWHILKTAKIHVSQLEGLTPELLEEVQRFLSRVGNYKSPTPEQAPEPQIARKPKRKNLGSQSIRSVSKNEKNRMWGIEGILNSRLVRSQWQYLIDWEGDWKPTWEPFALLSGGLNMVEAIKAFHDANPDRPKPTQEMIPVLYE
jgi:hypothetical protein